MDSTQTHPTPLFEAAASHPVQLSIDRPTHASRLHVVTRAVILLALAALCSSSIYWVLYLILPAVAALVVSHKGGERAMAEEGTTAVQLLRWLAGFERPPRQTYVVHGEPGAANGLAEAMRAQLGWQVTVATDGATVPLRA